MMERPYNTARPIIEPHAEHSRPRDLSFTYSFCQELNDKEMTEKPKIININKDYKYDITY